MHGSMKSYISVWELGVYKLCLFWSILCDFNNLDQLNWNLGDSKSTMSMSLSELEGPPPQWHSTSYVIVGSFWGTPPQWQSYVFVANFYKL